MAEEKEIPDLYADHFMIAGGPYGAAINFAKSPPRARSRQDAGYGSPGSDELRAHQDPDLRSGSPH